MELKIRRVIADPLFYSNCFIVSCPETSEGIVIDPGNRNEAVFAAAAEEGVKVVAVVYTHGHIDHVGGAAEAKAVFGAPLLMHEADDAALAMLPQQAASFGLPEVEVPTMDRALHDGERIEFGGCGLEVIHTPGHSPGGVCLYGYGHLFAGDTLFQGSIGRSDLPGGDGEQLIESIKTRLLTLPPETVVHSGHGPDTTIGEETKYNPFLQ